MVPGKKPRVTINEVAAKAEVSVGTVSNVINHPEKVSPQVHKRVKQIMKELNYWPNSSGRALVLGKTDLIGSIFFDLSNPFFAYAARFLEQDFQKSSTSVIVMSTNQKQEAERACIKRMMKLGVQGLVVCSSGGNYDLLKNIQANQLPVFLFAQRSDDPALAAVGINDFLGMEKMAEYLCERGIQSFCFVQEPAVAIQHYDRWQGFLSGVKKAAKFEPKITVEVANDPSWNAGSQVASRILKQKKQDWPECFVCLNDYMALGVANAINKAGLEVGKDIAVTGFDDLPYSQLGMSPLTTVKQPIAEMISYMVEQFEAVFSGKQESVRGKEFLPELVIRKSA